MESNITGDASVLWTGIKTGIIHINTKSIFSGIFLLIVSKLRVLSSFKFYHYRYSFKYD